MEFGKVIAKYLEITDKKERSIIFNAKVKEAPSKGITNKAVVDDKINPPLEPTVTIYRKQKKILRYRRSERAEGAGETGRSERTEGAGETGRSERTEGAVKPEDPKEPKEPVKP